MRGEELQAALARALGDPEPRRRLPGRLRPRRSRPPRRASGSCRSSTTAARSPRSSTTRRSTTTPSWSRRSTAAATIALENELLHEESAARLVELQASRERIVTAGDTERRRLERNLHDGAQQRLVALAMQLRLIEHQIHDDPEAAERLVKTASEELALSLGELRELARGIHPAVLDHGLEPALQTLAGQATVPTRVRYEARGARCPRRSSSPPTSSRRRRWPTSPSTRRRRPPTCT